MNWLVHETAWFYGVMVSTLDFESSDPSSNLGRTFFSFVPVTYHDSKISWFPTNSDCSYFPSSDWKMHGRRNNSFNSQHISHYVIFLIVRVGGGGEEVDFTYKVPSNATQPRNCVIISDISILTSPHHQMLWEVQDEVAEWLRRWTANPLGSARVGSNPILVGCSIFLYNFSSRKQTCKMT